MLGRVLSLLGAEGEGEMIHYAGSAVSQEQLIGGAHRSLGE